MKTPASKTLKTCSKGHTFYKTSDCPACPACEKDNKPESGFLSLISAPARRALQREGIATLKQLSRYTEEELAALHGVGPATFPKLRAALKDEGLSFKK